MEVMYGVSCRHIHFMHLMYAPQPDQHTVHGLGDKGTTPMMINSRRQKGYFTYTDDGSTRWPAIHRLDFAVLFRLALEMGTAGATYNAVAEQGVAMKDIVTVIGKHLQLPLESKFLSEAAGVIGLLGHLIDVDNHISSNKT